MDALAKARWEMIEAGGRTAQSFGLNRLFGQIYMLLYLHAEPLSLDSVAGQLGVSKASASIACRQLEAWGAVRRRWQKGDRRDYYAAESSFRQILQSGLMGSLNQKLESARRQIERSLALVEQAGGNGEATRFLRQRLREAETYRSKIARLLNHPLLRRLV